MELIEQKMQRALADLYALTARTQSFEQKYGLLSADFYALYQAGQLDTGENLRDVTLWAGAYESKLRLEETVRQLSQQRLAQLAERERFAALLQSLGSASEHELDAALAEREVVEPEAELTPEVITRLQERIAQASASTQQHN